MDNLDLLFHWLDHSIQLTQRICVVVVAAFILIRFAWLRRALRGSGEWRHRLTLTLFFGLLAIVGTHSGIVLDLRQVGQIVEFATFSHPLREYQAIVGFRDSMALAAGLAGGPWVGLGAGFLGGLERWSLGGFVGLASGISTLVLGVFAGGVRQFRPHWAASSWGVLVVALAGTALQRLLILVIAGSDEQTRALTIAIVVPVAVVNCLCCVLFLWIVRDLDRERLEQQARQAQLEALLAQVEPHFLNNALTAIQDLIHRSPAEARDALAKLARFFDQTRQTASMQKIPLGLELEQLERYLDFQRLRFGDKLDYRADIDEELLDFPVPPRSLQTLVENALTHGRDRHRDQALEVRVTATAPEGQVILKVSDNGRGMEAERLTILGRAPVESARGGGTGLYRLAQSLELGFGDRAKMSLRSRPDAGTEVVVTLPAEDRPW